MFYGRRFMYCSFLAASEYLRQVNAINHSLNLSQLSFTALKESCKENKLFSASEEFSLCETGLPTPRHFVPESRSLAAPYSAEAGDSS
jgi:hypothetical protein